MRRCRRTHHVQHQAHGMVRPSSGRMTADPNMGMTRTPAPDFSADTSHQLDAPIPPTLIHPFVTARDYGCARSGACVRCGRGKRLIYAPSGLCRPKVTSSSVAGLRTPSLRRRSALFRRGSADLPRRVSACRKDADHDAAPLLDVVSLGPRSKREPVSLSGSATSRGRSSVPASASSSRDPRTL
jgi:hypothetical protein